MRRLTLDLPNTLPQLQKGDLKQCKYDKYMYFNKTSQSHVVHHFTYSAFKAELNFTAPEACLRLRFRLLPLGKRMCYECRGHWCMYRRQQREEQTPHVSIINTPTNTDVKGDEARRSLRPVLRSATANPFTPIHIMRYKSADTCDVEACWKSSFSHYRWRRFWRSSGLRCRSKAAHLLGWRVRIPPEAQMYVSDEFWV